MIVKIGKVSESILKRSVFSQIKTKRKEVLVGAGVGEDCAALKLENGEIFVISTDPITGTAKDVGKLAVHITANDIASSGAEPIGIMLSLLLPEWVTEREMKEIMGQVEDACHVLNIQIMGGHTEVTKAVNQPVMTVTGVGKIDQGSLLSTRGAKPGQDIILSKWIGLEGTSIIAKEKEKELLNRFPKHMIERAKEFDQYLSIIPEAKIGVEMKVSSMHDVTEGGIFGALWEMAEASEVGLEIDLKEIPVKQETIEICEYFLLNPYCLISSGSLLMAGDNGYEVVRELKKAGIHGAVIGKAVKGRDRVVINDNERRYLEPPKSDELYKVMSQEG
ncbi:hydrogenase maturation factor [bacterium 1XD42-8]|jgi:hydrogenase expression/formation protein HypE|nr:hydrogenase maturation factor [Lachnospiraceae bacterium]RKJ49589.1 hydrogenase maturation factor [bacterium 1XD42-8]